MASSWYLFTLAFVSAPIILITPTIVVVREALVSVTSSQSSRDNGRVELEIFIDFVLVLLHVPSSCKFEPLEDWVDAVRVRDLNDIVFVAPAWLPLLGAGARGCMTVRLAKCSGVIPRKSIWVEDEGELSDAAIEEVGGQGVDICIRVKAEDIEDVSRSNPEQREWIQPSPAISAQDDFSIARLLLELEHILREIAEAAGPETRALLARIGDIRPKTVDKVVSRYAENLTRVLFPVRKVPPGKF
ncbi:hypothetical protein B0H65DRAFT_438481 [Neurospora tetraspora]|uniref:Uncharacterized protein n=1 Tax=Neurospora tetraspora TaxID=94610 RepID=A0AAE0MW75_9PEZI|nr:hypothetical protein B0H65DRAFT_438481 [Neurospora tetraspora]